MDDMRGCGSPAGTETGGRPIGIGVDIEEVERWVEPKVDLHVLFTSGERSYCDSRGRPAEAYAGHWCLKEAVVKAVAGVALISPRQVEIAHHPDGRPRVAITVRGLESIADWIHVSVSHTKHVAVAVAMLFPAPPRVRGGTEITNGTDTQDRSVVLPDAIY
jgi:phosphopantetheine--protein transferase-like protein